MSIIINKCEIVIGKFVNIFTCYMHLRILSQCKFYFLIVSVLMFRQSFSIFVMNVKIISKYHVSILPKIKFLKFKLYLKHYLRIKKYYSININNVWFEKYINKYEFSIDVIV